MKIYKKIIIAILVIISIGIVYDRIVLYNYSFEKTSFKLKEATKLVGFDRKDIILNDIQCKEILDIITSKEYKKNHNKGFYGFKKIYSVKFGKQNDAGNWIEEYEYTISDNVRCGVEIILRGGNEFRGNFTILEGNEDMFKKIAKIIEPKH